VAWRLLTNHLYVLACVAVDPELRVREIAARVGITERATQAILHDLVQGGYVEVERLGRRNRYRVDGSARFPHPMLAHAEIAPLLELLGTLLGDGGDGPAEPVSQPKPRMNFASSDMRSGVHGGSNVSSSSTSSTPST
jgi:DNA-binding transcriptional ArsR family regulator